MLVRVAFLPRALPPMAGDVAVVVDVLRATTTLVCLLEAGASGARLVENDQLGPRLPADLPPETLLCGEELDGGPSPVCHFGPSPSLLPADQLCGRPVLFFTTNGTQAVRFAHAAGASVVLTGALRNGRAAAEAAGQAAARGGANVIFICSGRRRNVGFALDDAYTAGRLVDDLMVWGRSGGMDVELDESAHAARRLASAYATPEEALRESGTGALMRRIGRDDDVAFCARADVSLLVPSLADWSTLTMRPLKGREMPG